MSALAGSRTRVYCLEGNNANRYTTNAYTNATQFTEYFRYQKSLVTSSSYSILGLPVNALGVGG